ncbi:hypothetical protein BpHYR1_041308 [Brachionus plicatilis]|uniref:Uncharacterized protein n=1 Tax=Brachionus plicatilis TaxID=10195 RepID=A0A3M7R5I4_BRAPC|nr:hypothetical protein BpHYR1_041308 [Brachionus plicatilis]
MPNSWKKFGQKKLPTDHFVCRTTVLKIFASKMPKTPSLKDERVLHMLSLSIRLEKKCSPFFIIERVTGVYIQCFYKKSKWAKLLNFTSGFISKNSLVGLLKKFGLGLDLKLVTFKQPW